MTMYFMMHVALFVFVYLVFGDGGLKFQIRYTIAGLCWVETVNYIEHYGLRRKKIGDEYEAVNGFHSWNAPASTISAKIQRHSDHHCHGYRPYQILRHYKDVPTLPYEYFICLLMAYCPPVWYYVLDPVVDAVERAQNGIVVEGEEDAWNKTMPMSKADKWRDMVAKTYLGVLTFGLTYLMINGV